MEADLQPAMLDPVALAALAALLLAAALEAARPADAGGAPVTTARQDLWLARHRVASARALLDGCGEEDGAGEGERRVRSAQAQMQEALTRIQRARGKPGWHDLPAEWAAALDRALPEVEQALAILPHCRDGDTRRRVGAVLADLHGVLDGVD